MGWDWLKGLGNAVLPGDPFGGGFNPQAGDPVGNGVPGVPWVGGGPNTFNRGPSMGPMYGPGALSGVGPNALSQVGTNRITGFGDAFSKAMGSSPGAGGFLPQQQPGKDGLHPLQKALLAMGVLQMGGEMIGGVQDRREERRRREEEEEERKRNGEMFGEALTSTLGTYKR